MISRSDLIDINKKKAILVDHNERGQSIEGIEDIDILEIIDHHRVSDISTVTPLYFRVEPVGCTCSIICRIYEEQGIEIPKEIAGLMLSAIISDTLLFHSPTCTDFDREMAERLSEITGVDMQLYGMEMIRAGSSMQEESPEHILSYDRKRFMFGEYKVSISQINTGDYEGLFEVYDDIIEEMEAMADKDGLNLVVLLVTDVVVEGTELIAIGDARWIAENAFHLEEDDQSIFLPGVFSRKKQIVPKLMNAAKL
jgi:manganese-dependent inorganic pyrophosphatase